MAMQKLISFFSILVFIVACESEHTDAPKKTQEVVYPMLDIETLFEKNQQFSSNTMTDLLKELKICNMAQKDENDFMNPACSPFYFKFFIFNDQLPLENSFLLQIKSKTNGFPLRRLLVFQRERGELVKVNGFVANLIGVQQTKNNYYDLLLRFNGKEEGETIFYNCVFKWKNKKYEFEYVRDIEGDNWGGPVKLKDRDSVSKLIYQELNDNKMFF